MVCLPRFSSQSENWKETSHRPDNLADQLGTEGQTMAGQWWAGPHLYCPCLEVHIDLLLKLPDCEEFAGTLCLSSQRDIESTDFVLLSTINLSL